MMLNSVLYIFLIHVNIISGFNEKLQTDGNVHENATQNSLNNSTKKKLESFFAFLLCASPCNNDFASNSSISTCVFHPLNRYDILTTKACVELAYDIQLSRDDDLEPNLYFDKKYYNIDRLIMGYCLIPNTKNSSYDLSVIRLSDPLSLPSYMGKIHFINSHKYILPLKGYLANYFQQEDTSELQIRYFSVYNIVMQDCEKFFKGTVPSIDLSPEMFCVIPAFLKPGKKHNMCSELDGAAVISIRNELIGLVISQKNCDEFMPAIAFRASQILETYAEVFDNDTKYIETIIKSL